MINAIKNLVPPPIKEHLRARLAKRYKAQLFGPLAPLVPAVEDMFDGPQNLEVFKANGDEFLKIYRDVCGLQPDETMLDVGSGIGRKTLPLTGYFNRDAMYEGIDITKAGITWCNEKITPRFPNFRFQHINVYNKHYNPEGKYLPSEFRFPFDDNTFTFVMLGSVFTHMLPDDLRNYLSEVHRVLKPGGRCLITYFLLNRESLDLAESGKGSLDLKYNHGIYRAVSEELPELAVAFDEQWIKELYRTTGLSIKRVDYGSWCARQNFMSYQDNVLASKDIRQG